MITKIQRDIHPNFNGEFIEDVIFYVAGEDEYGNIDFILDNIETKKLPLILTENYFPFSDLHYQNNIIDHNKDFYCNYFKEWEGHKSIVDVLWAPSSNPLIIEKFLFTPDEVIEDEIKIFKRLTEFYSEGFSFVVIQQSRATELEEFLLSEKVEDGENIPCNFECQLNSAPERPKDNWKIKLAQELLEFKDKREQELKEQSLDIEKERFYLDLDKLYLKGI